MFVLLLYSTFVVRNWICKSEVTEKEIFYWLWTTERTCRERDAGLIVCGLLSGRKASFKLIAFYGKLAL